MTVSSVAADFSGVGNPSPSGRIHLRSRHELLPPGNCGMCGSATHTEPYVDPSIFSVDEWYTGQLYFCQTCIKELAEAIGCLSPEQSKFLLDQYNQNLTELEAARNELANLRRLRDAIASNSGIVSLISDAADASAKESEGHEHSDAESGDEPFDFGENNESESPESVKKPDAIGVTRTPKRDARKSGGTLLT